MGFFLDVPVIVWLAAAFAGGIALADWLQPSLAIAGAVVGSWGTAWGIFWVTRWPTGRLLGAILALGALGLALATLQSSREPRWPQAAAGHQIAARGIVDDPAEATASGGWRAAVRLTAIDVGPAVPRFVRGRRGREARARQPPDPAPPPIMRPVVGMVRLDGRGRPPVAPVGAEVLVRGRFRLGVAAGNPGERSERAALRRRGLAGIVRTEAGDGITIVRPAGWSARGSIAAVRRRVVESALRALPAPYGGLFLSLLLGIDTYLTPELYQQFARAGLVHLLVVSGAQVAIVAGACAWAAQSVRLLPRRLRQSPDLAWRALPRWSGGRRPSAGPSS